MTLRYGRVMGADAPAPETVDRLMADPRSSLRLTPWLAYLAAGAIAGALHAGRAAFGQEPG
jgi:hypothetical protein